MSAPLKGCQVNVVSDQGDLTPNLLAVMLRDAGFLVSVYAVDGDVTLRISKLEQSKSSSGAKGDAGSQ